MNNTHLFYNLKHFSELTLKQHATFSVSQIYHLPLFTSIQDPFGVADSTSSATLYDACDI